MLKYLDCKGQRCPIPIVKISMEIKTMEAGEKLKVEADDKAFKPDLDAWIKSTGNQLISFESADFSTAVILKE